MGLRETWEGGRLRRPQVGALHPLAPATLNFDVSVGAGAGAPPVGPSPFGPVRSLPFGSVAAEETKKTPAVAPTEASQTALPLHGRGAAAAGLRAAHDESRQGEQIFHGDLGLEVDQVLHLVRRVAGQRLLSRCGFRDKLLQYQFLGLGIRIQALQHLHSVCPESRKRHRMPVGVQILAKDVLVLCPHFGRVHLGAVVQQGDLLVE
mmetsp:Transcript_93150/g.236929  ORF Transcript_93150/g.236929 Transcript_93150/m.236929 type:complete len:206 (-) Transcript_93150:321-938(-)